MILIATELHAHSSMTVAGQGGVDRPKARLRTASYCADTTFVGRDLGAARPKQNVSIPIVTVGIGALGGSDCMKRELRDWWEPRDSRVFRWPGPCMES